MRRDGALDHKRSCIWSKKSEVAHDGDTVTIATVVIGEGDVRPRVDSQAIILQRNTL